MPTHHTVIDHLLQRLSELGVDHVFGVPGDFTLDLLDRIDDHEQIRWIGTANELGAGYAADGYARIGGFGVVCTTFGVGELSAINAIAGSYAEHVPVLHLVGAPSSKVQLAGRATHHSLGDGDFAHTARMTAEVTVAQAVLSPDDATDEIDRLLSEIVTSSRPGYLAIPTDVAMLSVDVVDGPLSIPRRRSDPDALAQFTSAAAELLDGASTPVVLADILVSRAHAEDALHALLAAGGLPYSSLLWGRRVIDESGPRFIGTYIGAASEPEVRDAVEGADRLITVGVSFTDLITRFFSQRLDDARRIDLLPHSAVVAGTTYPDVEMVDALGALTSLVGSDSDADAGVLASIAPIRRPTDRPAGSDHPLTQVELWDIVADALQPGDLVIADQGTAYYGFGGHRLPHDAIFLGQPLWASIGYTLPATLGAALAAPHRRPVLLIGDGAAQLTIQELGTIARYGVPAIVVVVNNDGFTVERAIHGPTRAYNDIAHWRWTELPSALGADPDSTLTARADTSADLAAALAAARAHPQHMVLIEAVTDRLDVPPLLEAIAAAAAGANRAPS